MPFGLKGIKLLIKRRVYKLYYLYILPSLPYTRPYENVNGRATSAALPLCRRLRVTGPAHNIFSQMLSVHIISTSRCYSIEVMRGTVNTHHRGSNPLNT
jgi:hypothetical protein